MLFAGMTLLVYAGPCYIQTTTIYSYQVGCYETTISPIGKYCPSFRNPFHDISEVTCAVGEVSEKLGRGTSGNQQRGKMSQGTRQRFCYTYKVCKAKLAWNYNLPIGQHLYFNCSVISESFGYKKRSSFEPVGMDCPCPSP
jgi:hypothetical protein